MTARPSLRESPLGLVALLLLFLGGCTRPSVDLDGRGCRAGDCLQGYDCHPELNVCAPAITVGCDGTGGALCPRQQQTGGPCPAQDAFIPCADDAIACEAGCRTCIDGQWSGCSAGSCDGDDCPCIVSNGSVEICDGIDNDCDGTVDNAGQMAARLDCEMRYAAAAHVATWGCATGDCAIVACEVDFSDESGGMLDGCETTCIPTQPATESCDGVDNDCDGTVDSEEADGCIDYWVDGDGDGVGAGTPRCLCIAEAPYLFTVGGDCDDESVACITLCEDLDIDDLYDCKDDCIDADGDNYGVGTGCDGTDCAEGEVLCNASCVDTDADGTDDCADPCVYVDEDSYGVGVGCAGADCDDDPNACGADCNPGLIEICNGLDDDCSGAADDGCVNPLILASNLGAIDPCVNAAPLTVSAGTLSIDTTNLAINSVVVASPNSEVVDQDARGETDIDIAVFYFSNITIDLGTTLSVSGTRALALVSCGDVDIAGTLRACAGDGITRTTGQTGGAGGWSGGAYETIGTGPGRGGGGTGFDANPYSCGGGGGGGHCGIGGAGGSAGTAAGGAAGSAYGVATLVPLRGGSGGGGGGSWGSGGRMGGGGGGAVQIVANGALTVSGTITACGAGGGGTVGNGTAGGGGGAGGAILLEALSLEVTSSGRLAVNGGGGGGGDDYTNGGSAGITWGEDGRSDSLAAAGGLGADGNQAAGDGGPGGAGAVAGGGVGESLTAESLAAGGGGGGAGVVRINSAQWSPPIVDGNVSPAGAACYSTGQVALQ